jgi:hypothetical protein
MTELIAKPIIEDQYWVVTDGEKKVGNVQANSAGYEVILNGSTLQFNNTADIKKKTNIKFQVLKSNNTAAELPCPKYPTPDKTYNNVFDVKRKLHLFTKSANSKCLHAAGWYAMTITNSPEVVFCPKYIFIQRYPYKGPFKSEDEANSHINSLR